MPAIFGLRAIHFWQAVGLLVPSRILFGGFHRSHGGGWHRRHHMMRRWEGMTPEEREKFPQEFRRCEIMDLGRFFMPCFYNS